MTAKVGTYNVNGKRFHNKLQAILYANETKADITWDFYKDVLDNVDWTVEPSVPLLTLYAERAKQIREEYDYVIIMCSGGADSTNVLYSFLDNGVKVDEVVAGAPIEGLKNWTVDANNTSVTEMASETMLAQIPLLNNVAQSHPEVKLTINDYFNDMITLKPDELIYKNSSQWLHWSAHARYSLDKFKHLRELAESGKKIGIIYGTDKPIICRSSTGNLFTVLNDAAVMGPTQSFTDDYDNVEIVLFYYTPNMPQLMVKQAHELCRYLYKPENWYAKSMLWDLSKSNEFNDSNHRRTEYQRAIVPCIYPTIEHAKGTVWQSHKAGSGLRGGLEIDAWMYKLHPNHVVVTALESELNSFMHLLDSKYKQFANNTPGVIRFTNYWRIGHESSFSTEVTTDNIIINKEMK